MNGNEPTATAESSNDKSTELRSVIGTLDCDEVFVTKFPNNVTGIRWSQLDDKSTDLRSVIKTIKHAHTEWLEYLEIDSMTVGEPDSPELAESQPIIRILIKHPSATTTFRMGIVSAHPIYNDDQLETLTTEAQLEQSRVGCAPRSYGDRVFQGATTETQLEQALAGYQVRVELDTKEEHDTWPLFGIDYGALGFAETYYDPILSPPTATPNMKKPGSMRHNFRAHTGQMPFTDAVTLVDETVSTLRNHRKL